MLCFQDWVCVWLSHCITRDLNVYMLFCKVLLVNTEWNGGSSHFAIWSVSLSSGTVCITRFLCFMLAERKARMNRREMAKYPWFRIHKMKKKGLEKATIINPMSNYTYVGLILIFCIICVETARKWMKQMWSLHALNKLHFQCNLIGYTCNKNNRKVLV